MVLNKRVNKKGFKIKDSVSTLTHKKIIGTLENNGGPIK